MKREIEKLVELMAGRVMITKQDLAMRYGVTERTIERWAALGILPAADLDVRRTLRWRASTIHRWEKGRGKNGKKPTV